MKLDEFAFQTWLKIKWHSWSQAHFNYESRRKTNTCCSGALRARPPEVIFARIIWSLRLKARSVRGP